MKILINTVASIAFLAQFISFTFSALNLRKPESTAEAIHNDIVIVAYICSLLSIVIFAVLYNFHFSFLRKTNVNMLFLLIVLIGCYIIFSQLFILQDFYILSCVILLMDYYIIHKIFRVLRKHRKWQ
jgi:hypothetical protein